MDRSDTTEGLFSGRRVLIVDDCSRTARFIQAELAGKGFEILLASSANEATRLLLKPGTRPDLVLLDVNMPGVNGAQLCRFIKGNEQFRDIKVVLCSAIEEQQLAETAMSCGADGFVHKESILGRWVLRQLNLPPGDLPDCPPGT